MPPLLKNILAVVAGLVIGSIVNMAIVTIGPMVIPPPDGVDMSDMEKFAENLKRLEPVNFLAPWLAHALGALVGGWIAALIAASHKMKFALTIGAVFLVGGIMVAVMYGGPVWFLVVDLIGAYLPMAYLGGRLAGADRP